MEQIPAGSEFEKYLDHLVGVGETEKVDLLEFKKRADELPGEFRQDIFRNDEVVRFVLGEVIAKDEEGKNDPRVIKYKLSLLPEGMRSTIENQPEVQDLLQG